MNKIKPTKRIDGVFEDVAKRIEEIPLSKFELQENDMGELEYFMFLFDESYGDYEERFLNAYFTGRQLEIIKENFDVLDEIGSRLKNTYIHMDNGLFLNRGFDGITYSIPEYAICYLEYGDTSDLEENEIAEIDDWIEREGFESLSYIGERYFDNSPEFGLACDCMTAIANFPIKD